MEAVSAFSQARGPDALPVLHIGSIKEGLCVLLAHHVKLYRGLETFGPDCVSFQ